MFERTNGIVLHSVKYSDVSSVVTIYTKDFGRMSYMVYGTAKKKSSVRSSFLQPLTIVELVVKHQPGREIQQIKELKPYPVLVDIPSDPVKNTIALFLSELFYKILKQPDPDEKLFDFLFNSILILENLEKITEISNFHLLTLVKLTRFLGFFPNAENLNSEQLFYFDIVNGVFKNTQSKQDGSLPAKESALIYKLMNLSYEQAEMLPMSRETRQFLLAAFMEYYKLHISDFTGLKSLTVLEEVFD